MRLGDSACVYGGCDTHGQRKVRRLRSSLPCRAPHLTFKNSGWPAGSVEGMGGASSSMFIVPTTAAPLPAVSSTSCWARVQGA